jgi:hypothetical protein
MVFGLDIQYLVDKRAYGKTRTGLVKRGLDTD